MNFTGWLTTFAALVVLGVVIFSVGLVVLVRIGRRTILAAKTDVQKLADELDKPV
jgi:hypothetical protein